MAIQPVMAQQLPSGMTASEGVTVDTTDPNILVINAPDHATIDWDSFSIGADQSVRFILPNETSSILNRVLGGSATDIWGALYSNGIVFLVNTNGINFHANAQIDIASLIASTLDISKENFQSGNYEFQKVLGSEIGKILNEANISATNIVFLAEQIQNKGVLEANLGRVVLGSGSKQTISFDNNGSINLVVDEGTANSLIENSGTLRANGGKVMLTAKDINVTLDTLVNNTGIIEATRMVERDGVVEFVSNGAVENSGTINTNKFSEKAYTFRTSGALLGGNAHFDNLDGAAEIGGSIGSNIYDTGDLIVTSDIYLGNAIILGADLDSDGDCSEGGSACDGNGVFYMQEGTSILGQGYNLTIYSSQNPDLAGSGPTLRTISGVVDLTLYASYSSTEFVGHNDITSNSLSIRSGSYILNGDSYYSATGTTLTLNSGDLTTGALGIYASSRDQSAGGASLTIASGASLSATSLLLSASEGKYNGDGAGTFNGGNASLSISSGATAAFSGDAVLNAGAGLNVVASGGTDGGNALIGNEGTLTISGSLSAQGGSGGSSGLNYTGGTGGSAGFNASANTTITGNLTLNSGSAGSDYSDGYNYQAGGAGGSAVTTGEITLNGSGIQNLTTGNSASVSANLTYSGAGTLRLTDDLDMNGNLSVTSGTFNANSQTQNYGGNVSLGSGITLSNAGNAIFDKASGTQTLNSGGKIFAEVQHAGAGTLQLTGNNLTVTGAFTNSSGTYNANGLQTTVSGLTTVSGGTYTAGTGNQNLNGGLSILASSGNSGTDGQHAQDGGEAGSDGTSGVSATYTAGSGITTTTNLIIQSGSGGNGGTGGNSNGGSGGAGGAGGTGGNATLNAGDEKVRVTGNITLVASTNGSQGSDGSSFDNNAGGAGGAGGAQGVNTYTGTLLMNGSGTQNITSNSENLGSLKYSGSGTLRLVDNLDLDGDFSVTSGAFNVNSRVQNYGGNVSLGSGITMSNSGTAIFDKASGTQTLDSGGKSFAALQHSGAGTLQLTGNNLTVTGAFTNSAGNYDANGLQTTVGGLTTVSGGNYTARSGNQNLNGGLTIMAGNGTDGTSGTDAVCDINICNSGSDGSAGVNGASATYIAGSGITSVTGNLNVVAGNGGSGGTTGNSVNYMGNDYGGGLGGAGGNGGAATLDAGNEKVQVSGNITLSGGTTGAQGGNSGGAGGSAGGVTNTGTIVLNGAGTQNITSGGQVFSGIAHSGTGTLRLLDAMNVGSSFTNSAGTFNLNGFSWWMTGATFSNDGTVQLIGSETITGLTNNDTDSGTWNYTGSGSRTLKDFGANDYFNLVISGSGTFTAASDLDLNNSFTQSAGTFVAPASMNVAGDFGRTGGTFTAGTGTVTLDGSDQAISGNTTFYNLTKADATNDEASRTLSLASGNTQTVTNSLTLDGLDEDDRLVLNGAGTFDLTNAATFTGNYLSIQDGTITDNSSGLTLPLDPANSINLGGTTGWFTPPPPSNTEVTPAETANRENEIQRSLAPFVTSGGTDTNSFSGSDFSNTQFSNDQPEPQDTENSDNENTNEESGGFSESINPNAPIILSNNLFEVKQGNLQEANGMQVNGDEAELV